MGVRATAGEGSRRCRGRTSFAVSCALLAALTVAGVARADGWSEERVPGERVAVGFGTFEEQWPALHGISCPTTGLCVAVGERDAVATTRAPGGQSPQWQVVRPWDPEAEPPRSCYEPPADPQSPPQAVPCDEAPPRKLTAVSCPSTGLCVATSYDGYVYASTEPTGAADAWRVTDINEEGATHLSGVSCPSPSLCVAVSGGRSNDHRNSNGRVLTTTNPIAGHWHVTQLGESLDFRAVSCGTNSLCVAVAEDGQLAVSTNPTGGVASWKEVGNPAGPGNLQAVACVGNGFCAAGNAAGNVLVSTNPSQAGGDWSEANAGASVQITGLSCVVSDRCVGADDNGDVLTSLDPMNGSWSSRNLVPYEKPAEEGIPPLNAFFAASCATPSLCAVAGANGRIFTSVEPFATPAPAAHRRRHARKRPRTVLIRADRFRTVTQRRRVHARYRFFAVGGAKGFRCRRDEGRWKTCHSPLRYWASLGDHVLRVRAVGATGLLGPIAVDRFRVIHNPYARGGSHRVDAR